jgi:putative peptidoglycan lipid II flippase
LGILSSFNMVLVLIFHWYFITELGAGVESDSLYAAITIPQLVVSILNGTLLVVLIPILGNLTENEQTQAAWSLFTIVGISLIAFYILLYLTTSWWISLIVPGFSKDAQILMLELVRILLIGMVFGGANTVQLSVCKAREQYVKVEIYIIISNILSLLLLTISIPYFGIKAVAWIFTLRLMIQAILFIPSMGKPIYFKFINKVNLLVWKRLKPLFLGTSFYTSDPLIDRFLLSTSNSGSISLYYISQQILGAVSEIISRSISSPLILKLSKLYEVKDNINFIKLYNKYLIYISLLSFGIISIIFLLGNEIINYIMKNKSLTNNQIDIIWLILILMSGRLALGNIGLVMTSMLYSKGDTRIPTNVGVKSFILGTIIKIIMFNYFGVLGLAFSVTVYYAIYISILYNKIKGL